MPSRETINVTIFVRYYFGKTNIGSKLASKIPNASTTFESYINKTDFLMETK